MEFSRNVTTLLTTIHVTVCLMMVGLILLQQGKGSDIGAAFGGGSHTLFGARGATSFLAKLTVSCAAIFMCTSLFLAVAAREKSGSSIIDDMGEIDDFFTEEVAPAVIPDLAPTTEGAAPAEGGN